MAETDPWTPADDDYVRRSLNALKADVDTLPLADVRFVKARGGARRRRTMLGWTAGAAAAALVAAVVGFSALGGDNASQPVPPATSTTTAPTTSVDRQAVSPWLREPGALPLGKEWKLALGWSSDFTTEQVVDYEADPCLGSTQLGTPVQAESLLSTSGNIQGGQTRWMVTSGSASSAADAVARAIGSCRQGEFAVTPVQTDSWPRLYSYTAGGAGSGWYAVATAGEHLAVLTVVEPDHPSSRFSREQVERLAAIATERLEQYGDSGTTTVGPPSPTTTAGEDMPVVGSEPLLPSSLFVPASQWSSELMGRNQRTYAGPGAQEGSASIVQCETDEFQAGVGGRYGIVSIRAGSGDANYIGKQRVRLFEDAQGYELVQADIKRLDTLVMKGCGTEAARTTAKRGPVPQTWLLTTTVSGESTGTMYQWVGMTGMQTEGAVSTLVFHGTDDGQGFSGTQAQGFAELERLMDLARRR
jgi:hypothetical protein